MSRIQLQPLTTVVARVRTLVISTTASIATIGLGAVTVPAQAALGTPFIHSNTLTIRAAQLSRSGGPETTTMFGIEYGRRFGQGDTATRKTLVLRGSARAFDEVEAGVLDISATVGISRQLSRVRGLSVAASTGLGMKAWGDDIANTGRVYLTIPANAGASYDLRVRGATISPFVMGTVSRYDLRTSVDDVRESVDQGWDAHYTTGASLRLKKIVMTSSRVSGEYGMPDRSRWMFSAGVSF